jgi:phage terminase large subunit-like protein
VFRSYDDGEEKVDNATVDLEWYLTESDEPEDDPLYIEPEGMVYTALHELGACLVAIEPELPEPD